MDQHTVPSRARLEYQLYCGRPGWGASSAGSYPLRCMMSFCELLELLWSKSGFDPGDVVTVNGNLMCVDDYYILHASFRTWKRSCRPTPLVVRVGRYRCHIITQNPGWIAPKRRTSADRALLLAMSVRGHMTFKGVSVARTLGHLGRLAATSRSMRDLVEANFVSAARAVLRSMSNAQNAARLRIALRSRDEDGALVFPALWHICACGQCLNRVTTRTGKSHVVCCV